MSDYDFVRRFLSDRPIAFHPEMARKLGGINEALFFQQIAYWSDKGADPEWIYKTRSQIEDETALTRGQQERARKTLRSLGVISEVKRGVPAKLYYRINWPAVHTHLEIPQDAHNAHPRVREVGKVKGAKRARQDARNAQSITESTSESTPKKIREKPFSDVQNLEYDAELLTRIQTMTPEERLNAYEQSLKLGQLARNLGCCVASDRRS